MVVSLIRVYRLRDEKMHTVPSLRRSASGVLHGCLRAMPQQLSELLQARNPGINRLVCIRVR
jgi:hypothetical protein